MRALWGGAQDAFQGWWLTPTLGVGHWLERALVGQRLGEAWGECWSGGERPSCLFLETNAAYEAEAVHAARVPREDRAGRALACPVCGWAETPVSDQEI